MVSERDHERLQLLTIDNVEVYEATRKSTQYFSPESSLAGHSSLSHRIEVALAVGPIVERLT
jgi:hypothetical protein